MSRLSNILSSFGFDGEEKQIALLDNLRLAGYFEDEKIWQMVNMINVDPKTKQKNSSFGEGKHDAKTAYDAIRNGRDKSKSTKDLLENIFESGVFDDNDISDMVCYLGQNAFARLEGQERNELGQNARLEAVKDQYLQNAQTLGMIDAIDPAHKKYHESWIQGAARYRTETRVKYWRDICDEKNIDPGQVRFLSGDRELWVEIDRLPDGYFKNKNLPGNPVEETKEFFVNLARENNVRFDEENQFIVRDNRTYLNSLDGQKITETMMTRKVIEEYFPGNTKTIIDARAEEGEVRINTQSGANAAYDLFAKFGHQIAEGEKPLIALVTNQPYVARQKFTTEASVAKKTKKEDTINFDACGPLNEVGVTPVHSEFGAWIGEGYMKRLRQPSIEPKRAQDQMMCSKRCKDDTIEHHRASELVSSVISKAVAKQVAEQQSKQLS